MLDKLCDILKKYFNVPEDMKITPETRVSDFNLDSLDTLDLIVMCEKEFNVDIEDKKFKKLKNVEDVCNYLLCIRHSQ